MQSARHDEPESAVHVPRRRGSKRVGSVSEEGSAQVAAHGRLGVYGCVRRGAMVGRLRARSSFEYVRAGQKQKRLRCLAQRRLPAQVAAPKKGDRLRRWHSGPGACEPWNAGAEQMNPSVVPHPYRRSALPCRPDPSGIVQCMSLLRSMARACRFAAIANAVGSRIAPVAALARRDARQALGPCPRLPPPETRRRWRAAAAPRAPPAGGGRPPRSTAGGGWVATRCVCLYTSQVCGGLFS